MISNFFKVTFRNLHREKMYAMINIAGLSLAIACCLILGIYLYGELTYDQHNTKYREIFRVVGEYNINGKLEPMAQTSALLGEMLASEYSQVRDYVRFFPITRKALWRYEDTGFFWDKTAYASKNVFDVFDHDFIYGDPDFDKNKRFIAVSETFARKYFGDENPVGKTIHGAYNSVKITHVFADLPKNSHFKYDLLMSDDIPFFNIPDDANQRMQALWGINFYTYLLMPENYDISDFKNIIDPFYERHMKDFEETINGTWRGWLQPLTDIHYNSDVDRDEPTGNKLYLYGFMVVAIFILLVACINYMNLATARATKRAKEIGMRKILGSNKRRLIIQFLVEAIIFSIISLLLGLVLVELILKTTPINVLLDNKIALDLYNNPALLGWMLLFSLVLGLISGIYPALYLSSVAPLSALVGRHQAGKGSIRLREILVLIQFTISVCVIACTLLMAMQMRYISNKPLGFDKENRLAVTVRTADVLEKIPTIKKELLKNSNILGASLCNDVIGDVRGINVLMVDNNDNVQERTLVNVLQVGNDYIDVMGMELLAGRDFSKRLLTDVGPAFIVNETMVKKMGWDQPLGKHIQNGKVIGVVKDFHYNSLRTSVEPFMLARLPGPENIPQQDRRITIQFLIINLAGEDIFRTIEYVEDIFAEFDPRHPFEFEFLDDFLNNLYFSEQRLMKLIGIFAAVCIFISCMGLFGLASFTIEQRTKEIGIRKVLGATVSQIITMLARNILYLVLGGAVVASLIAYFVMDEWLMDFAYRIDINMNIWVFLAATAIAAAVAFITVALQSFRTASDNPINAIRYE
jgi:putative ABC transport system permease protein